MLQAGVSADGGVTYSLNVIPTSAKAGFDIRVDPATPIEQITGMLDEWTAGEDMSWEIAPWAGKAGTAHHSTSTDRIVNPWWGLFEDAIAAQGIAITPEVFPAGTDSRLLRELGIPALGFSPMRNSPILLHEHDEYIGRDVFLEGIGV
jgi:aminoacylase